MSTKVSTKCTMAESIAHTHTQNLMSLIPAGHGAVNLDMDRLLKNVHLEDKTTIHNVVSTLHVLRTHDFVSNVEVVKHRVGNSHTQTSNAQPQP